MTLFVMQTCNNFCSKISNTFSFFQKNKKNTSDATLKIDLHQPL